MDMRVTLHWYIKLSAQPDVHVVTLEDECIAATHQDESRKAAASEGAETTADVEDSTSTAAAPPQPDDPGATPQPSSAQPISTTGGNTQSTPACKV